MILVHPDQAPLYCGTNIVDAEIHERMKDLCVAHNVSMAELTRQAISQKIKELYEDRSAAVAARLVRIAELRASKGPVSMNLALNRAREVAESDDSEGLGKIRRV